MLAMLLSLALLADVAPQTPAPCATHTKVEANQSIVCQVPARSAGGIYFYWDIAVLRGVRLHCTVASWPGTFWLRSELCSYPDGLAVQWSGDGARFPLDLDADSGAMAQSAGDIVLKYYVPPSDIPSTSHITCVGEAAP